MAALYDLFRTPQQKGETKVRYHARSVVTGKTSTKDLIRTISKRSAFKEGVVTGVLIALEEVLRDELAAGKSVQLDGVGAFRISAKSPSVRDRHEIRAESIEFKGVVYKADKQLLKKLSGTKFMRTKYSQCSNEISEIEIDGLLMDYFKEHDYITTKEMQQICGLSNTTALRRLKSGVKEGKLSHPGHLRAPFYFPVPGNYGVSRD
ncbi:MAG: HU family DNA-binding protein [Bacteroidaceae bacterium]|nr:HU family DNA-binding protein [Bacteroidaceae bacterium]